MKNIDFLLINPCIYDFAAYDLWIKPTGLYNIESALNSAGFTTCLIDCLDINTFSNFQGDKSKFPQKKMSGEGKFLKKQINKPETLKNINRKYSRYGIPIEALKDELKNVLKPKAVLITSMMTYWYPSLFDTIKALKELYPNIPIITGGVYATLCNDHANKHSGADLVLPGPFSSRMLTDVLKLSGIKKKEDGFICDNFKTCGLHKNSKFLPVLTSRGCPYKCSYCASRLLYDGYVQRSPESVIAEIEKNAVHYQIKYFTFYDDALLIDPEKHILPILKGIYKRNLDVRFHVPNGLHMRNINDEIADLMIQTGFKTLRFGFEYADHDLQKNDGKITNKEFKQKINILKKSGFSNDDIGINVMAGIPGQTFESAFDTVKFIQDIGLKMYVSEYSPIPGTKLWNKAVSFSKYDIKNEPLFHNNSLFPCEWDKFTINQMNYLKTEARRKKV